MNYYDYGSYNDILNSYSSSGLTSSAASANATNAVWSALGGMFAAFAGIIVIVAIALTVLYIIGMWKVFTKAGEKGWKSIIPFYNTAILFKISGMSPYLVFIYIATIIPVLNIFAAIALAIIGLYQKINLMKGFKASTGLTVAMIMVPFITYLILGFGKSEYYGYDEK